MQKYILCLCLITLFFISSLVAKPSKYLNYYQVSDTVCYHTGRAIIAYTKNTFESCLPLSNVDVGSFKALNTVYAKDKTHVYYKEKLIKRDAQSFMALSSELTYDKHGFYRNNRKFHVKQNGFMKMCKNPNATQRDTLSKLLMSIETDLKYSQENCKLLQAYYQSYSTFHLSEQHIKDITPLSYFKNTKSLFLSGNNITDVSSLKGLNNLSFLTLEGSDIIDFSPLYPLPIEYLSISISEHTKLDAIPSLSQLTTLEISGLKGKEPSLNLCDLKGLKNLKKLTLHNTGLKDLKCIDNFKELETLSIIGSQLKDIDDIRHLKKLQSLFLENTPVTNLCVLSELPNLTRINLKKTGVRNLGCLHTSTSLQVIFATAHKFSWCSPTSYEELKSGISCFNKDGTEKSFFRKALQYAHPN